MSPALIRRSFLIVASVLTAFYIAPSAQAFFTESIRTSDITKRYRAGEDIKVLIVPGHDSYYSGAHYNGVDEESLNLKVAEELVRLLGKEDGVDVAVTRDEKGYTPLIQKYLDKEALEIAEFREKKRKAMEKLIKRGKVKDYSGVSHNNAMLEVAQILYGINKYANDNDYDLVIHLHFNDYGGRPSYGGIHSGFAIYVPERQYSNAKASRDLATRLKDRLFLISGESSLPIEEAVTEDQELIAIGRYDTLNAAVSLIEYGYIYESQFTDPLVAETVMKELASQTHKGIMAYLRNEKKPTDTATFPSLRKNSWSTTLAHGDRGLSVLALQDLLRDLGHYPAPKYSLNTCPLSGIFGVCTEQALKSFQKAKKLKQTGELDKKTRSALMKARSSSGR